MENEFIGLPNSSALLILLIVWWEWNDESVCIEATEKPRRQMGCHKDEGFPERLILPLLLLMQLFAILYTAIAISCNMEYWNTYAYWNSSRLKSEVWRLKTEQKLLSQNKNY